MEHYSVRAQTSAPALNGLSMKNAPRVRSTPVCAVIGPAAGEGEVPPLTKLVRGLQGCRGATQMH